MKVFKFGGASVKDAAAIRNVAEIIQRYAEDKIVLVVSAMGKTTNKLERIYHQYLNGGNVDMLVQQLKSDHIKHAQELFTSDADLEDKFDQLIPESLELDRDAVYDYVISSGEQLSSYLLERYLSSTGVKSCLVDARSLIKTDDQHRAARVLWEETNAAVHDRLHPALKDYDVVVTQGFIGQSPEGLTTTLGREGSDYTGAILSNCLNVENYYVWKDVPGILTGDPKRWDFVDRIDRLNYREAIEMTFFGAKVIHPKTIQPLYEKKIMLHVRSFIDPETDGTVVGDFANLEYPTCRIWEDGQILLKFSSRDYDFVGEEGIADILSVMNTFSIKVNLMRNTAVSLLMSVVDQRQVIAAALETLSDRYDLEREDNLALLTLRHASYDFIKDFRARYNVIHMESIPDVTQMLIRTN